MDLILKIAWRNIMRHRGKSLIIGAILFLGALLMTVGNGVISGMEKGLEQTVVNSFTGDVVIISDKQESDNAFMEMMGKAIEPIYNMTDIRRVLAGQDCIQRFLPVGKNMAMVINEDGGAPGYAYLMGVDFSRYRTMFPGNCSLIEGRMVDSGEVGVLIPTGARKQMYDFTSIWFAAEGDSLHLGNLTPEARADTAGLSVKRSVVFMGANTDNTTTDVRVGVKGIINYRALNHIWGHFVLMDIESYRRCLGYIAAADRTADISSEKKALLSMGSENLDALFSSDSLVVADTKAPRAGALRVLAPAAPAAAKVVDIDAGAYNLVLVLLKPDVTLEQGVQRLNAALHAANLGVRAVSWRKALGPVGSIAAIIKGALFVFVMFLFFVAIIIIVNTLSMAALERTTEIGMMRAVGARKGFVSVMFFAETAILAALFGGAGIVCGILSVKILALCHITSSNDMVQLLFGGDTFHPLLTGGDLVLAVVQLTLVTLLAVVYPISVARGITPLDAIQRD